MHGGAEGSGAPSGERNGAYRHGLQTETARAERGQLMRWMRLMRGLIHEFNVYRWAGRMLLDASSIRRRGLITGRAYAPTKHTRSTDVQATTPVPSVTKRFAP